MTTIIGDFKLVHGGADSDFFKKAMADITATTDTQQWMEEIEDGMFDEIGSLITLFDYADGGIGSVYIEVQPLGDVEDHKMHYIVYSEFDGYVDEEAIFSIGEEDEMVADLDNIINRVTKEFAEKN